MFLILPAPDCAPARSETLLLPLSDLVHWLVFAFTFDPGSKLGPVSVHVPSTHPVLVLDSGLDLSWVLVRTIFLSLVLATFSYFSVCLTFSITAPFLDYAFGWLSRGDGGVLCVCPSIVFNNTIMYFWCNTIILYVLVWFVFLFDLLFCLIFAVI